MGQPTCAWVLPVTYEAYWGRGGGANMVMQIW
jgi:hypothetical protein